MEKIIVEAGVDKRYKIGDFYLEWKNGRSYSYETNCSIIDIFRANGEYLLEYYIHCMGEFGLTIAEVNKALEWLNVEVVE